PHACLRRWRFEKYLRGTKEIAYVAGKAMCCKGKVLAAICEGDSQQMALLLLLATCASRICAGGALRCAGSCIKRCLLPVSLLLCSCCLHCRNASRCQSKRQRNGKKE
ncbi:hypothetical protein NPIL_320791, partial [Nephila pilipes]